MKLINRLEKSTSLYSGQSTVNVELNLRPVPKVDEDGRPLKPSKRYYVFRLLYFTGKNRTDFPAIVRNEHVCFKKDATGKVKSVSKICCPTTKWAKNMIQEAVDKDYCPICKYSFDRNADGFKNFRSQGIVDEANINLAKDTERRWAAYLPVFVVSDPLYENNNNHLRVLHLTGDEGKVAFEKIYNLIFEAQEKGYNIFNGEEGVNVAILCEKALKQSTNRKGEPIIDKDTGEPRTYMATRITDVRLLEKNLHEYTKFITDSAIESLHFDETYGVPATREQLSAFLTENYLMNGVSDADFGENDDDFSDVDDNSSEDKTDAETKAVEVEADAEEDVDETATAVDEVDGEVEEDGEAEEADEVEEEKVADEEDDEDDEFEGESHRDAINRIMKGRTDTTASAKTVKAVPKAASKATPNAAKTATKTTMKSKMVMRPNAEKLRDDSLDMDPEDLPF